MAELLEARGHELLFICGGVAREVIAAGGRRTVEAPVLHHQMHNNQIRLWRSLAAMTRRRVATRDAVPRLAARMRRFGADLLISDFETYSTRAAERLGLPIVCLDHQQILTRARVEVPWRSRWEAWVARRVVEAATPRRCELNIISSFFFPRLRPEHAGDSVLVPPILRREVRARRPSVGDHVLVYHNAPEGLRGLLEALAAVDQRFVIYNLERPPGAARYANLEFRAPSTEGFLRDLASCRAVVSTAGFTLISESIYLGKPMLLLPNGGLFEQTVNALYFERCGWGRAIQGRGPTPRDLREFLARVDEHREALRGHQRCGNELALAHLERVLSRLGVDPRPRPKHAAA